MTFDVHGFVERVKSVLPGQRPIALHEPCFGPMEQAFVDECIRGGWVSGNGPYVQRFEQMLAERLGVPHVIATNTGTAALHTALRVVGVGPRDEVMMPALTFAATATAVAQCGGVPYFTGDCPGTVTAPIRAKLPRALVRVALFGHLEPAWADFKFDCPTVVDAAEALGSSCKGRPVAAFGDIAILSFNGNKIVTTGGGGAIVTRRTELAVHARHVVNTARVEHPFRVWHNDIAPNYRMPDLNAALGCAQLARLDEFLEKKRALAERYFAAFENFPGVECLREPPTCASNYWLNAVLVPDAAARDNVCLALNAEGIQARAAWDLIADLPPYRYCGRDDLTRARDFQDRLVCLPSGAGL